MLFGLYHLDLILEHKDKLTNHFTEETNLKKRMVDVSMRHFEEEEMELEKRSKVLTREFKNLMKLNKFLPSVVLSST